MALFNHATKELTAKIVFYGPGLCGKTTNLKILHQRLERGAGKLLSLSTAQDRTIYFDLLPIELGNIKGYTVRFQVCTVPGQVFYNETRRIVLRGVDGLVFVVDSQWSMLSHNLESFQNLKENLADEKIPLESLPVVIQYNKRDLPSALSVEALQESLGFQSYPYVEAVASEGMGVLETFKLASKLTFVDLLRRLQRGWQPPVESPDMHGAESSLGSASAPGASTQPFIGPGPAVTISAPAPEPEETPAAAPVLAMAGAGSAAAEEEPSEWVPPSAEGTFADLSDDSLKTSAARSEVPALAASAPPQAPAARPEPRSGFVSPTPSGERPRSRPETTAPVTPLDDKLNAVLAEARRAAAGRISGSFKRDEPAIPETAKAEARRVEALEKALEAERDERRVLATELQSEKAARDVAAARAEETAEGLRAAAASALARADAAYDEIAAVKSELAEARSAREAAETAAREASEALAGQLAALRTEVEENRRGIADAVAGERAARESAEAAAHEASAGLAAQLAGLTEQLEAAKAAAEASRASGDAALERSRRLEEALRGALRDLTPGT